jgi:prepilin-type N-terminal cleavage/methylation domain-containing protein
MGYQPAECERTPNRSWETRPGLSLLELLVCLAVVSVLMGLLLPAVQKVRAASQRSTCLNNLRQLGVATHAYEQAHGEIPLGKCNSNRLKKQRFYCFSAQAKLLPFLEQAAIAHAIDWTDQTLDFPGQLPRANSTNQPLLDQRVTAFLCPADAEADGGSISYRQSVGWNYLMGGRDPLPKRLLAVTDGLSHTALFSERSVGGSSASDGRNPLLVDTRPEDLAPACVQAQEQPVPAAAEPGDPYAGTTWLRGADRHARYGHLFPPNSRLRDCECTQMVGASVMTARSAHTGGVNSLVIDGHAAFVGNDVQLSVWRAWGSPNGGEPTP